MRGALTSARKWREGKGNLEVLLYCSYRFPLTLFCIRRYISQSLTSVATCEGFRVPVSLHCARAEGKLSFFAFRVSFIASSVLGPLFALPNLL